MGRQGVFVGQAEYACVSAAIDGPTGREARSVVYTLYLRLAVV